MYPVDDQGHKNLVGARSEPELLVGHTSPVCSVTLFMHSQMFFSH